MTYPALRETTYLPDRTFPINVFYVTDIAVHWHEHAEWIYVRRGCARVQVDGTFQEMFAGDLVLVNSKQLHGAVAFDAETQLVAIVFNEALVRNSGLDSTDTHYFGPIFSKRLEWPNFLSEGDARTADIRQSVGVLVNEFAEQKPGFELLIKAELFRVFGLIYRYFPQQSNEAVRSVRHSDFTGLLEFLRENYHTEISVHEAAKRVNMSPNHFCRMFKRITGKTLVEYIHMLRISQAEQLLRETDLPITRIAHDLGFGNLSYFGRVFKAYKQVTPREFRNRLLG